MLEQNVSAEVAAAYKRAAANAQRLADIVAARRGVFPHGASLLLVGAANLIIGDVWAISQPSPGMAAAYAAYPELRQLRLDLKFAVRELVATIFVGLQHRTPMLPMD